MNNCCNCGCKKENKSFFEDNLDTVDKEIFDSIEKELKRQQTQIELIASENIVSKAVLQAQGSIMTNKYAEGYSGARYYGGTEFVDIAEDLAISRAKELFNAGFVNVQPHSGSQANQGVYVALLQPNDTIMGLSLDCGGHLTHGAKVSLSGKWLNSVSYGLRKDNSQIDYDEVMDLAMKHRPKLLITGGSAYPRSIDFKKFREIADKAGCLLMVDMAHFAGLVAAGYHDNPLDYADVVTTTTHKTLRGPRGGMILTNNQDIAKKINSAIFPGIQGGPLMHVIAAKAVAFKEALQPSYKEYIKNVIDNIQELSKTLLERGYDLVSGGTDTHLVLVDLRSHKITGKDACDSLERANITCNKNSVPYDEAKPTITSGLRLGSPAATSRGFGVREFREIGMMSADIMDVLSENPSEVSKIEQVVKEKVKLMCDSFPIY